MTERIGISTSDLRRLLDVVDPARCGEAGEELPYSTLADLAELLPCDDISFNRANQAEHRFSWQTSSEFGHDLGGDVAWDALSDWQTDPQYGASVVEADWTRLQDLDLYTRAQAEYVDACLRGSGISGYAQMCTIIPTDGPDHCTMALQRMSGSQFTAREILLFTLLRPHLIVMHREQRRRMSGVAPVTQRQRQILELVAAGHTNRQIARALFVSEATVRKHLENAYERLDVSSRTAAVAKLAASP